MEKGVARWNYIFFISTLMSLRDLVCLSIKKQKHYDFYYSFYSGNLKKGPHLAPGQDFGPAWCVGFSLCQHGFSSASPGLLPWSPQKRQSGPSCVSNCTSKWVHCIVVCSVHYALVNGSVGMWWTNIWSRYPPVFNYIMIFYSYILFFTFY